MTGSRRRDVEGDPRSLRWLFGLLPLALLAGLLVLMVRTGPPVVLSGGDVPPIETLTFQRVELGADGIVATVLNDGPDPVTIAQVQVDDAYWQFTASPSTRLSHLRTAVVTIPYPWVRGDAHVVRLVTSSGVTFDHEIAVAVPTPTPGLRHLGVFALIGLYVGVLPVAIGLFWYPWVAQLRQRGIDFLLALTIGLLLFLFIDASAEGLEAAGGLPQSYQGPALFVFAAIAAYLALDGLGSWLRNRPASRGASAGWVLALLIAVGIGLHNMAEGLAIGGAFALGEAALGSMLIVGFALHNTTEGLAIVAPLARESAPGASAPIGRLVRLGLIGGVPTIAGAWLGGFVYAQVWALVFLGLGVGAIAQVMAQIVGQMTADGPIARRLASGPVLAGLLAGFAVMYTTGMLVG
jgi:zinc transporter ZupT